MSSFNPRLSKLYTEKQQTTECKRVNSPFEAQRFIFEVLKNHFLTNAQAKLGFPGTVVYNEDYTKSDIKLELSHSFKPETPDKYPAVFVSRGPAQYNQASTFQGTIGKNTKDGTEDHLTDVRMIATLLVINKELAPTETFAEYALYPFLYFNTKIQNDYGFKKVRVVGVGQPQLINASEQNMYMIELQIELEFYQTWRVNGDYLRLKTVDFTAET